MQLTKPRLWETIVQTHNLQQINCEGKNREKERNLQIKRNIIHMQSVNLLWILLQLDIALRCDASQILKTYYEASLPS